DDEKKAFYSAYGEAILAHPAVTGFAIADRLPLGIAVQTAGYLLPGVPSETPDGDHDIDNAMVGVGYFDAMGVGIVSGRAFIEADVEGEPVAIVSEAFAQRYYPGEDVVGRTIQSAGSGNDIRIVGVAEDTKVRTLGEAPRPYVYGLQGQISVLEMQVVVRGTGTSEELVAVAGEILDRVAPDMVLFAPIKSMDEHLALLLFPPRMAALVLSAFGALALLLAAIGVYGVVSYAVSRRTRELGIRMSLGATAGDVVGLSIKGGMRLVLVGGALGVLLAGGVTWSISNYLFGISSQDVVTFVVIPLVLTTVAFVAAWVPARRASQVDPVRALRAE
ncbi:MAG: ABC transporter permease, partial [Gemmatimonadetes bacterium]|nr:ABC transporter permease [Gemmatimonadota bacterium]